MHGLVSMTVSLTVLVPEAHGVPPMHSIALLQQSLAVIFQVTRLYTVGAFILDSMLLLALSLLFPLQEVFLLDGLCCESCARI